MAEKNTETTDTMEAKTTKATDKTKAKKSPAKTKNPTAWRAPMDFPYAVIKTGGKQYCVAKGDQVLVEKLNLDPGAEYSAEEVLFIASGPGQINLGKPTIKGAKVKFEVLQQTLGPKILIRHARRRQSSQKTLGHRQPLTRLVVKEIVA
ncbi:MAG: 50S ribosomal protein L21 [Bdellovibrionota bacterium]